MWVTLSSRQCCGCSVRYLILWILYSMIVKAVWGTIHPPCNVTLPKDVSQGAIMSPNFPYSYLNELHCHYRFSFPYKSSTTIYRLCLTFHRFNIEHHTACSYDFLSLDYGGPKLCGNNTHGSLGVTVSPANYDLTTWPTVCYSTSSLRVEILFKTDVTSRFPGFYATYNVTSSEGHADVCGKCHNINCGQFRQKFDARGCPTCVCHDTRTAPCQAEEFVCFQSAMCLPRSKLCDGSRDCPDGSDETYEHAQCEEEKCKCLSQVGCTFDFTTCQIHQSDSALWRLNSGSTLSKNTGPSFDHTLMAGMSYRYSSFLYFEASYIMKGRTADLIIPSIQVKQGETKCFQFWYHMWGEYMGDLDLQMRVDSAWTTIWVTRGKQNDMWHIAQVDLVGFQTLQNYQLRFRATRGQSYTSDIALDDVSLLDGKCIQRDFSCTFENGLCGWSLVRDFLVVPTPSILATSSNSGHVAMATVVPTSSLPQFLGAELQSSYITHNVREPKCLRFRYHKTPLTKITVDYKEDNGYQHEIAQIYGQTRGWGSYEVDIPRVTKILSPYKIVIMVWPYGDFMNDGHANIYLDEIYLRDGPCHLAAPTVAPFCDEPHQFLCYNGHCVKRTDKCDGIDDCGDNSDEESLYANCSRSRCGMNFQCKNGNCIHKQYQCNSVDDCDDGSDEDFIYAECTEYVSVGGILGIIFGVISSFILICAVSVFICKFTKRRRLGNHHRRNRNGSQEQSAYAISHMSPEMMPPPYQAVVNEGFVSDSLYELPPSYDTVVASLDNNNAANVIPVPPYSFIDPNAARTLPPPVLSGLAPSMHETVLHVDVPVAGTSAHSRDMVLPPAQAENPPTPSPHSTTPPDIISSAIHSENLTSERNSTLPPDTGSRRPSVQSQTNQGEPKYSDNPNKIIGPSENS